ncbi:hypothetical protein IC582_023989 [Cucumis melo]
MVMSFGLTNAPSNFMRLMNHILYEFSRELVVVYFDNILIYSKTIEDRVMHVRCVLDALRREISYANLKKCCFSLEKVNFLGFVVFKHQVKVNYEKVKLIREWPTLKSASEIISFHGLVDFYRRFIRDFNSIASPFNELIKRNVTFDWGQA